MLSWRVKGESSAEWSFIWQAPLIYPHSIFFCRVFVRADFNVPLEKGVITDDTRIRGAIPTIKYLTSKGAKVILSSHLGRPKGGFEAKFSLAPITPRLSELLGQPVALVSDCIGEPVVTAVAAMKEGDVVLLENVRFYPEEEKNDKAFAEKLAANADVFVNDAFGTAHRAHGSTEGVTAFLTPSVAGFLLQKELDYLQGKREGNSRDDDEKGSKFRIGRLR